MRNGVPNLRPIVLLHEGIEPGANTTYAIPNLLPNELMLAASARVRWDREVPIVWLAQRQGGKLIILLQERVGFPEPEVDALLDLDRQPLMLL